MKVSYEFVSMLATSPAFDWASSLQPFRIANKKNCSTCPQIFNSTPRLAKDLIIRLIKSNHFLQDLPRICGQLQCDSLDIMDGSTLVLSYLKPK